MLWIFSFPIAPVIDWSLTIFHFLVTNLEPFASFNKFNFLCSIVYVILQPLMTLRKSLKQFFAHFLEIKNLFAPLHSSNLLIKIISWGIVVFVCLDELMRWIYFWGKNSLISFLLHNHCFLSFQQVSHSFLFTFYWFIKK